LELTVLGGSPAWPNPGQAASGYLLERGDVRMLVDCGTGIAGVLRDRDPGPLTHILISHFHADHWFDLVPLHFLYLYGAWHDRHRPHVFLPPGGRDVVDRVATIWNGSIASFDRAFEVSEYDPASALVAGDLQVRFAFTHHYCPCFAMRFDTPAATIAYTADTAPDVNVERLVGDADLLIAEAALVNAADDNEGERGHMAPDEAAGMATRSRARSLLLAHVPIENGLDEVLAHARAGFSGPVDVARPGLRFTF
jgi:ribonuclease BN (tRNA processing enzyme)